MFALVTAPSERLRDLRFDDIQTFLAVRRSESITSAARALFVTPSQVSKAVARLEDQLGVQLLARGARGVSLTAMGIRIAPQLEEIANRVQSLHVRESEPELTVAAPSFLNALFLPVIAELRPTFRVRGIELPPALVRAYAAENFFDMALMLGFERFPETWVTSAVGSVRKALFATPAVAKKLGPPPVKPEALLDIPFVCPVYNHNGQFLVADEGCPLSPNRRLGHEVQTIALGLELASRTGQLVFGPVVVAQRHVREGLLVEVDVEGWDVREEMLVACNGERVRQRDLKELVAGIRAELERMSTLAGPGTPR